MQSSKTFPRLNRHIFPDCHSLPACYFSFRQTNAMRILEKNKISYDVVYYECDEFKDGVSIAEQLGEDPESCFKTLATQGKSGGYYIYVLPVAEELDLKKCANAVGE